MKLSAIAAISMAFDWRSIPRVCRALDVGRKHSTRPKYRMRQGPVRAGPLPFRCQPLALRTARGSSKCRHGTDGMKARSMPIERGAQRSRLAGTPRTSSCTPSRPVVRSISSHRSATGSLARSATAARTRPAGHRHMLLRRAPILSGALIGFADGFGPDAATGQVRASNKLRITAGIKRVRAAYK